MSLRLWSEKIPLRPIAEELGVTLDHLHIAGEPMAREGRLAERRAPRHYASVQKVQGANDADVAAWCRLVINKIESQELLVGFLRTGEIVGTLWIAVLGSQLSPMPNILADVVNAAVRLKLGILLENYTDLSENGVPKKSWLVEQAAGP